MPCIYRRAALHKIGIDNEVYGIDVCSGEVDVTANDEGGSDFRACLSFLRQHLSEQRLAAALLANGPVSIRELSTYAGVVARAMDEVRQLLRDKGNQMIQRKCRNPTVRCWTATVTWTATRMRKEIAAQAAGRGVFTIAV